MFLMVSEKLAKNLKKFFRKFEEEVGQVINKDKSTLMFSIGTLRSAIDRFRSTSNIHHSTDKILYSGSSLHLNLRMQEDISGTHHRVRYKFSNWKGSYLSQAGWKVLIQVVTMAIPDYWLGHQPVPRKFHIEYWPS